jgi:hypothetical protein
MITRHVQLGKVIGGGVTRMNAAIARLTVQMTLNAGTYFLGVYTTTLNNDGTIAAPTNAQVPVIELAVNNNYESDQLYNDNAPPIPGPIWIGLSTTENTYTATANTARIDVDIEEYEIPAPAGLTTVSNAGTANKVTIWTNPVGPTATTITPHSLYDVFVQDLNNSAGAQLYLMVFALPTANVVNGAVPIQQWTIPISGTQGIDTVALGSRLLNFGQTCSQAGVAGYAPFQQGTSQVLGDGLGTAAPNVETGLYTGCVLAISTTAQYLTLATGTAAQITARYL